MFPGNVTPQMDPAYAAVAALLVAEQPRRQTNALLEYLLARMGSPRGAILVERGESLAVFASIDVEVHTLAQVIDRFHAVGDQLRAGEADLWNRTLLYPLLDGGTLLGVLYLEGLDTVDLAPIGAFALPMAKGVAAAGGARSPATSPAVVSLGMPPDPLVPAETPAERLVRALEGNEWNISRVSRVMGVSRKTLYQRMARYGIPRTKIPKSLDVGPRKQRA